MRRSILRTVQGRGNKKGVRSNASLARSLYAQEKVYHAQYGSRFIVPRQLVPVQTYAPAHLDLPPNRIALTCH